MLSADSYTPQRIALGSAGPRIEFWSVDGHKIDDIVLPHAPLLPHGLPHGARCAHCLNDASTHRTALSGSGHSA
jgi:hypothetical protein